MNSVPGVCALGWIKYREHISLLFILRIIVYVTKKTKKNVFFSKPISDNGQMLKYRGKISVNRYIGQSLLLTHLKPHTNLRR